MTFFQAVLKYCAIALQAAVEEKLRKVQIWIVFRNTSHLSFRRLYISDTLNVDDKTVPSPASSLTSIHSEIAVSLIYLRNNTIEDPEFKQALSDLNPDVIYEKLKVICKRNPKEKFIIIYLSEIALTSGRNLRSDCIASASVLQTLESVKRNGGIQVRQNYQLIFFMIMINLCGRFHCSLWITKWTTTRKYS